MAPDPATDPEEQRLEELGERIEEVRDRAEHDLGEDDDERTFIDPGTVGRDEVDDAIVPPG